MRKNILITMPVLIAAVLVIGSAACSFAATLPTAGVSGVAVDPNPSCASSNSSGQIAVSATVTGTFDQDTDTTVQGRLVTVRNQGTITGYTRTDTETIVTVTDKTAAVTAADGTNSVSQSVDLSSGSAAFSGSLPVGPDGVDSASVSAVASETVTTQVNTISYTFDASMNQTGSNTTEGTPSSVTRTSAKASASTTYSADMNPPTLELKHIAGSRTVGGNVIFHVQAYNASPNQPYTYTITMTSQADPTYSLTFNISDTFRGLEGTKEPDVSNDLTKSDIPCDAPIGTYDVDIKLETTDICGNDWPAIHVTGTVDIGPGLALTATSFVIADYGVKGYGYETCFSATAAGSKINTYAGSNHIATLVSTEGPCIGLATLSGVKIVQTIPNGFAPFSIKKPLSGTHVFVPAGADLHYPGPEVTLKASDVKYTQNVDGTWTVTITLPGTYPANQSIYARTHVAQILTWLPYDGETFTFSTSCTTNGGTLSDSSSCTITKDNACVQ